MSESRTKNSVKNFTISLAIQIVTLIVTFVNRTVFIRILNADYLGINGLFTNILTILSFAELGLGSAILYSMYKPVREGDTYTLSALYNLYKKAYRIIATVILIVGLLVVPIIPLIINEQPDISENIRLIYVLFLGNTVCSYLFAYSKSLFTVHQRDYINVIIERSAHIACVLVQLVFLYFTHNYIGYLCIQICTTLIGNLVIFLWCNIKYSVITKDRTARLEKTKVSEVFSNIRSIMFYKVGSVILNATDNIIITRILSVTIVGICSNYTLLISTVEALLSKALNTIVASIGNLNASNSSESKQRVFRELNFCVYWIYGFCSIELAVLLNKVIIIWLGSNYVIDSYWSVLALILNFYIFGTNFGPSNYRVTMGFFKEARTTPIIASIINIVLSVLLGRKIGLFGIYIATSISRIFTFGIVDPITVSRKGLDCSPKDFYIRQILALAVTLGNGLLCFSVIKYVPLTGLLGLIIDAILIAAISNVIYVLVYFKTAEFKSVYKRFRFLIRRTAN